MTPTTLCRLCICSCTEFKTLFDDNEQLNGVYDIAVKYFDAILLNSVKEPASKVICKECWQTIYDFHKFQQLVINNQSRLEYTQPIVLLDKIKVDQLNIEKFTKQIKTEQTTILSNNSFNDSIILNQHTAVSPFDTIQINDKPLAPSTNSNRYDLCHRKGNDSFIAKWMGEVECALCKILFATYSLLIKHFREDHRGKQSFIICCTRKFSMRSQVVQHIREVHTEDSLSLAYKCKLCNESFAQDCELRTHISVLHKTDIIIKYNCEMCSSAFKYEKNLRDHYRQKHKEYPLPEHVCNYCKRIFKTITTLHKHKNKEHVGNYEDSNKEETQSNNHEQKTNDEDVEIIYENTLNINGNCTQTAQSELIGHELMATSKDTQSSLFLNNNNNAFSLANKLRLMENDALISKSIGDLECALCSKLFPTFPLLSAHFRLKHRRRECHIICCGRKIVSKWRVINHIREMHIGKNIKSYECQSCGASFLQNCQLRKHILKMHRKIDKVKVNREYQCNVCVATFSNEYYLRAHYRRCHKEYPMPEYICNQCDIVFKTRKRFDTHKRNEHIKQSHIDNNDLEAKEEYIIDVKGAVFQSLKPDIGDSKEKETASHSYIPAISVNTEGETDDNKSLNCDNKLQLDRSENIEFAHEELLLKNLSSTKAKIIHFDEFIKKWKGDLQCPICNAIIEKYSLLSLHFKNKHPQEPTSTFCCNLKHIHRNALCAHLRLHANPNAYQCAICKKSFRTNRSLTAHKRYTHFNQLRNNKEQNRRNLENDGLISKTLGDLECVSCSNKFATFSLLSLHFQVQHKGEKFHIICCGRKISIRCRLVQHIRKMHSGLDKNEKQCDLSAASPPHDNDQLQKSKRIKYPDIAVKYQNSQTSNGIITDEKPKESHSSTPPPVLYEQIQLQNIEIVDIKYEIPYSSDMHSDTE